MRHSSSSSSSSTTSSSQEAKFFAAIESGALDEVKRICTLDIKLDCKNAEGQTPLIVAITKTPMEHRLAVVKYFVEEQKVNLNILDNKWQSPLTYSFRELKSASDQKQHEVLQYILDHWQFPETKMMNYWIDECLRFAEDKTLFNQCIRNCSQSYFSSQCGKKILQPRKFTQRYWPCV